MIMRYLKRARPLVMAAAMLVSVGLLQVGTASASVPGNYCDGRSQESVVASYARGSLRIPLRCGTPTYGFIHISGRWNAEFESQIALTIARGEVGFGGTIYARFDDTCTERFRVVVNQGPIGGTGFRPQGIITAYAVDHPVAVAYTTPTDRTDCPIFVPVNGVSR